MSTRIARCFATVVGLAGLPLASTAIAEDASCRSVLAGARRLVLVTTKGFDDVQARLQLFERKAPDAPWRPFSKSEPAVIGRSGLAWGYPFRAEARSGEPIKVEGDGRSPAGLYRIGRSFGFGASARPGHLLLKPNQTTCVEDPASPAYNTIVTVADPASRPAGDDMGAQPLYRRGLVIDYPSDRGARAGSCIFLHIWRGPDMGTAGCVALSEKRVAAIQGFAGTGTAIAILPEQALDRFSACLPPAASRD